MEAIENKLKYELPSDYKSFLLNYRGFEGFIGPEYVVLWEAGEIIGHNTGYGIPEYLPGILLASGAMEAAICLA